MQIIKFNAMWCPAWLIMNSRYQKLAREYHLTITDYDCFMDSDEVIKYHIGDVLPVAILIDDNQQELTRIIGEQSEQKLREIITRYQS